MRLLPGSPPVFMYDCHGGPRIVNDVSTTWFDFDCDYCTGIWDVNTHAGLFHRTWVVPNGLFVGAPALRAALTARVAWLAEPGP